MKTIVTGTTTTNTIKNNIVIDAKDFVYKENDIFGASSQVFNRAEFATYPTDGLIFTPCDAPVPIHPGPNKFKVSWERSFKWKPPRFNTIDFFVSVRKNRDNQDFVKATYQGGGINLASLDVAPQAALNALKREDPIPRFPR